MNVSEYKNKNRRPITLPSGLQGWIKRPNVGDFRTYPTLMIYAMEPKPLGETPEEFRSKFYAETTHLYLRRCFIPEGAEMTDKEPSLCGPKELSIHDLSPEDALAIRTAVTEWSLEEQGKPAGEAAGDGRFPAGGADAAGASVPSGEGLRAPAAPPA